MRRRRRRHVVVGARRSLTNIASTLSLPSCCNVVIGNSDNPESSIRLFVRAGVKFCDDVHSCCCFSERSFVTTSRGSDVVDVTSFSALRGRGVTTKNSRTRNTIEGQYLRLNNRLCHTVCDHVNQSVKTIFTTVRKNCQFSCVRSCETSFRRAAPTS